MSEETTPKAKPAAKKAKPPALEDKPFTEFVQEHFLTSLQEALAAQGVTDIQLQFTQEKLPLPDSSETCWQVKGDLSQGDKQFNLYFLEENIKGPKAFSYSIKGVPPSTIESFMIDERKITLDLLVLYTLQRLNGQKWLQGN